MGYTIEIGEGSDQIILDANFRFDLAFDSVPSGSGLTDKIVVSIMAEGDVVESTAAAVINQIVDFSEEVTTKTTARRVKIKLDGTTKYDYTTSQAFGTPLVTHFHVSTEDEGGESHLHWTMGIFVQLAGSGGQGGGAVINFRTSYTVVKQNGTIIQKIWKAFCQASSAGTAESKVRSFAPAEERVLEEVEVFAQEAKCAGMWTWDARKSGDVLSITESIEITGGGADYEGGQRVGDPTGNPPDPILHEKVRTEQTAIVRGVVRGYIKDLQPPPPHWTENENMKRALAREINYSTVPDGEDFTTTGIYMRPYMEVWIATGGVPAPDHGDHIEYVVLEPPPTGRIANR